MPFDELHRFLHICQLRVRDQRSACDAAQCRRIRSHVGDRRTQGTYSRHPGHLRLEAEGRHGEWQRTDDDMVVDAVPPTPDAEVATQQHVQAKVGTNPIEPRVYSFLFTNDAEWTPVVSPPFRVLFQGLSLSIGSCPNVKVRYHTNGLAISGFSCPRHRPCVLAPTAPSSVRGGKASLNKGVIKLATPIRANGGSYRPPESFHSRVVSS